MHTVISECIIDMYRGLTMKTGHWNCQDRPLQCPLFVLLLVVITLLVHTPPFPCFLDQF